MATTLIAFVGRITMSVRTHTRTIHSIAPIRICDNGGWTDTWFAVHGKVLNIAVQPSVYVQVIHDPTRDSDCQKSLSLRAEGASRTNDNDPLIRGTIELMAP